MDVLIWMNVRKTREFRVNSSWFCLDCQTRSNVRPPEMDQNRQIYDDDNNNTTLMI